MGDYNSVGGIEEYLTDLDGLNRLIHDRQEAGYDREEHLIQFIILGQWQTDSCGNFGKCKFEIDYRPSDFGKRLPRVIETDKALAMVGGLSCSTSMHSDVPASRLRCPECGKGWTLDNAGDATVREDRRIVALEAGRSIMDIEQEMNKGKEGVFRFGSDPSVRNAKFIDMTPDPDPKLKRPVNEEGWRYHHPPFDHERLTKDYVAEAGDEALLTVFIYEHKRCSEIRRARESRGFFDDVFKQAGFTSYTLNEIPNEYCPCDRCAPWFLAKTPAGNIKVGWRKRVINIDWSDTHKDLLSLFVSEDVTKGAYSIHAWGKDKAIQYLGQVRDAV